MKLLLDRRVRVDQTAYQRAMRQQGKVRVDAFAIDNRKARRLAKSKKANKANEVPT